MKETKETHVNPYLVRLSGLMIIALVDIATDTTAEDSPRWSRKTLAALERRELVTINGRKLSKKGHAYLDMCQYEYKTAEAFAEAILAKVA